METKKLKKIPGPGFKELIAHGILLQENNFPFDSLQVLKKKYGDIIFCPWPNRRTIILSSPVGIKEVLRDKHNMFHKGRNYKHLRPLVGEGLLTSEDGIWREQRSVLSKEFQRESLIKFFETIKTSSQIFANKLLSENRSSIDWSVFYADLTFQIIGKIFFHESFGEDAQVASIVRDALQFETQRIQNATKKPLCLPDFIPTKENLLSQKHRGALRNVTLSILGKDGPKSSLMERMLGQHAQGSKAFNEERMIDQMMTIILAGHETTSNTMMWMSYLLSSNVDYLTAIRQEFDEHVSSMERFDFTSLSKLKLLRAAVYETMRLYPPLPLIGRHPTENVSILGYELPKNVDVVVAIYLLHHDEKLWNEPERFKPERFLGYDHRKDTEFTFIPFGHGARRCIGDELAMMEAMVIFTIISQMFDWKLSDGFRPIPVAHLTLQSQNGMSCEIVNLQSVLKQPPSMNVSTTNLESTAISAEMRES